MAQEFRVPEISDGVKSIDIAMLKVKEGDVITANSVVAEFETEKAGGELECPFAGKVTKVHAQAGSSIDVGAVLLTIEAGATASAAPAAPSAPAPAAAKPAPAPAAEAPKPAAPAPQAAAPAPAPAAQAAPAKAASSEGEIPAPAGPATRRLARELGVNLHGVKGSGAGGRITLDDVKAHVKGVMDGGGGAGSGGGGGGYSAPPLPDFTKWGPVDREPLNKIAKAAAANLSMCANVIPHVTQHDLIDITDLEAARKKFVEEAAKSGAPKVTMTAIVIKAAAICLKEFPKFNSSLDPRTNEFVYRRYFNIGCAVDTPNGLLVPVVKGVDQKSISQIAAELSDIAGRAREKKITLDEMQGSCFTITNLGGIGGTGFTPIVNYPEVAILGLSRGKTELKLVDGQIAERLMLPLSLSYDHRVINGADAARFVVRLGQLLSDFFQLAAHS